MIFFKAKVSILVRQVYTSIMKSMRISSYEKKKKKLIKVFSAKINLELMAPALQKTLTFNHFIIIYGIIRFLKTKQCNITAAKKGLFTVS